MRYSVPVLSDVEQRIACCTITPATSEAPEHQCSKSIANGDDIFEVQRSADYMDYTHSCTGHLHENVDASTVCVRLVWATPVRDIDIVFDGPPGPVSGRFIETEVPVIGQRRRVGLSIGEWVGISPSETALRIPVPAGWLVG